MWSWRLNDNLWHDPDFNTDIQNLISNFIADHREDPTSPALQWEALKCVLRGTFIKHSTHLKQERNSRTCSRPYANWKDLTNLIPLPTSCSLYLKPVSTPCNSWTKNLYVYRTECVEAGDKPRRLMVKAFHFQNSLPGVSLILQKHRFTAHPKMITSEFLEFYHELYLLDPAQPSQIGPTNVQRLKVILYLCYSLFNSVSWDLLCPRQPLFDGRVPGGHFGPQTG